MARANDPADVEKPNVLNADRSGYGMGETVQAPTAVDAGLPPVSRGDSPTEPGSIFDGYPEEPEVTQAVGPPPGGMDHNSSHLRQ